MSATSPTSDTVTTPDAAAASVGFSSGDPAAELRLLQEQLGVSSAREALEVVRRLQSRAANAPALPPVAAAPSASGASASATGAGELADPRVAVTRLREFSNRVATLNGTVSSIEDQLRTLYADREKLEREIGASEVDDVIAAFRHLQTTIASLGEQLAMAYEGRELLDAELGRSEPAEIVSLFRSVTSYVENARRELVVADTDRSIPMAPLSSASVN